MAQGSTVPGVLLLLFLCGSSAQVSQSYIFFPQYPPGVTIPPTGMKDMRVLHSWRRVEFWFPTAESRLALMASGHYVPGNAVILDADYWSNGASEKLLVTVPRMKMGIPATLAVVGKSRSPDKSRLLVPYPDWSWHGDKDCEAIISVFRVKVDECNRLWVIDSGVIDNLDTSRRICPPKVLVFDLRTDLLLLKYIFPERVLLTDSLLVTIAVDVRGRCDEAFAYIADVTEFGLIVFDGATRASWRVNSNYFYPFPNHGSFRIAGESFDLMDGVIGLALSPVQHNGDRTLFFHSLASVREGKVSTNLLRNASNFENGHNRVSKKFYLSAEVRPSQSAAEDMSRQKVLFFGLMDPPSIACWNARLPYLPSNLVTVAQSNTTLQFVSGLKIVRKAGKEEVLVTSSKFHSYLLGSLNHENDNFHILSASVGDLIKNTLCEPSFITHKPRLA